MIKNAFTIDVEDYYQVEAFAKVVARSSWESYESRVQDNTKILLDLLDTHAVKGTFFILGWVAQRHPELVKDIASRGHEIASHGMSHTLVYTQSKEVFRAETRDSKALLEDISQCPVVGYRAATYSITQKSLWALDILADLGFQYDSSIFPVHHDHYGVPGAPRAPHVLRTPAGYSLVEFPLSTKQLWFYRLPVSGGGYFRLFPYSVTRAALRSINDNENTPFIFYVHPWEIDPRQPRIQAKWTSRFRHYNNLDRCWPRLQCLLKDFEFTTAKDVLTAAGLFDGTTPRIGAAAPVRIRSGDNCVRE